MVYYVVGRYRKDKERRVELPEGSVRVAWPTVTAALLTQPDLTTEELAEIEPLLALPDEIEELDPHVICLRCKRSVHEDGAYGVGEGTWLCAECKGRSEVGLGCPACLETGVVQRDTGERVLVRCENRDCPRSEPWWVAKPKET